MFKISRATEKDVPAIIDIATKTWWKTYANILSPQQLQYMLDEIYAPETLTSHIANGTQTFLVLSSPERTEAFASFSPRTEDPRVYKIHKLYVLPGNQKRGYGRQLIEAIKTEATKADVHTLDLNVNRFNEARYFYERVGFKVLREEDVPIGPYFMNDYVMRLEF